MTKTLRFPRRKQFLISDIIDLNPQFKPFTVRQKVATAINNDLLEIVGRRKTPHLRGRPAYILARTPDLFGPIDPHGR